MNGLIKEAVERLKKYDGPSLRIMEVCGTHTHEIMKLGIRSILSEKINLISGPGCPVCVTPESFIEKALWLSREKNCTLLSFGDLLRVPGESGSLLKERARGAHVETVYSAADSVEYAKEHPSENIVFLAIGFETTIPGNLLAVRLAEKEGVKNYSILNAMKTMPKAYEAMAGSTDAFLYPGHVCVVTGTDECRKLYEKGVSGVVCGFTPEEIISSILYCVNRFSKGETFFKNLYPRAVSDEGNEEAKKMISEMTHPVASEWRGIGVIEDSGISLNKEFESFDAEKKYPVPEFNEKRKTLCRCGEVLTGKITPKECPLFGKACTPENPKGACMVSSEGTCSAYFSYGVTE